MGEKEGKKLRWKNSFLPPSLIGINHAPVAAETDQVAAAAAAAGEESSQRRKEGLEEWAQQCVCKEKGWDPLPPSHGSAK